MQGTLPRKLPLFGVFALYFLFATNVNSATLYLLSDIGILNITNDEAQTLKLRINDNDKIVGWEHASLSPTSALQGFTWTKNTDKTFPLGITQSHRFYHINNSGQVSGELSNESAHPIATLWNADFTATTSLNTLGGSTSSATAINDLNTAIGQSETGNQAVKGFLWTESSGISPALITESQSYSIDAINNNNWFAGTVNTNSGYQSFLYDTSNRYDINSDNPNILTSWVSDLNNLNQLVGGMQFTYSTDLNPRNVRTHAYQWDVVNGLNNLGEKIEGISWATGINDLEQIVGARLVNVIDRQAILWEENNAFKLAALTQNIENWELLDATDINNNGVIVGIGKKFGFYHGFALFPVVTSVAAADLSIAIDTTNPASKPGKRLLQVNDAQQLTVHIKNLGPDIANAINLNITTNIPFNISNIASLPDECELIESSLDCNFSQLAVMDGLELTIDLNSIPAGEYDLTAEISASEYDTGVNANNKISKKIQILEPVTSTTTNEPVQEQTPSNSGKEDSSEDNTAEPPQTGNSPTASKNTGCTVGSDNVFDPVFIILLSLALAGIIVKRKPSNFI